MAGWLLTAQLALASSGKLLILVDDSTEMPLADLQDNTLLAGIHFDLGQALAKELGQQPGFRVVPRKRIALSLQNGEADLICLYRPEWLPGPFHWSRLFLANADVVVTHRDQPRPRSLAALAGQSIGTILGFRYPELEARLGSKLVRDDAPNSTSNLRKLEAGRVHHAVVNRLYLHYQQKLGQPPLPLHPPLLLNNYRAGCALSQHSRISLPQLNRAIGNLLDNHTLSHILSKYR